MITIRGVHFHLYLFLYFKKLKNTKRSLFLVVKISMMKLVFKLLPLALVFASAMALQDSVETCDTYSKDKAKCLSSTENNEACSFCTSAAVGKIYLLFYFFIRFKSH